MEIMKAYVIGPDCFSPDYDQILKRRAKLCEEYGLKAIQPNDNSEDEEIIEPVTDYSLCWKSIRRIERADIILANLGHFRGPEPDSGTVFECAYAFAKGKKVYAYYDYPDMITAVEKEYGPVHWIEVKKDDGTTIKAPKDELGRSVENWGSALNLMLTGTITCIHGTFEDLLEVAAKDLNLVRKT